MQQLSLTPVCKKHGCEKVWMKNKAQKAGGQWKCRECQKEYLNAWRAKPGNEERYQGQRRVWALSNPEKVAINHANHRAANREAERKRCAEKQRNNRGRYAYLGRRRTARQLNCSVNLDAVDQAISVAIYDKAEAKGLTVDHIQPLMLQGEHAPWNFELLTLSDNSAKHARRPTLREVMRGERRYRLLRRIFEHAGSDGTVTRRTA